jgi:hypothetical protein
MSEGLVSKELPVTDDQISGLDTKYITATAIEIFRSSEDPAMRAIADPDQGKADAAAHIEVRRYFQAKR